MKIVNFKSPCVKQSLVMDTASLVGQSRLPQRRPSKEVWCGVFHAKEVQTLSSRLSTLYCHLEMHQIHSTTPLFSPAFAGARSAPLFPTYIHHMYNINAFCKRVYDRERKKYPKLPLPYCGVEQLFAALVVNRQTNSQS